MSSNTFLAADLHLSHRGIVTFLREDGITKERPWDNIHEMDEAIIKNWNSVVTPRDKVIVLGDVAINRSALPLLGRLNGQKVLVPGNHDVFRASEYLEYFNDIKAYAIVDKFVCTHIPLHPNELHRWRANIHGHLHSNNVKLPDGRLDNRYICVSLEQINFTPVSVENIVRNWEVKCNEIYV